jgi:hypothetical protein
MALVDDNATTDDEDVVMALREWSDEDVEVPPLVDRSTQQSPNLSQGLNGMVIQSPEKATLPSCTNGGHLAGSEAIGLASGKVRNSLTADDLEEMLIKHSPFSKYRE